MKKYVIAAMLAATLSTPAFAQQNPAFTGLRVEGLVGYDNVNIPGLKNPDGLVYGVGVGYDFAAGGVLVGVEADITDSTSKIKLLGPDIEAGRDIYVGARLGTIVGQNNLIYVKGGYTNARFSQSGFGGENGDGFRLGAGIEHAMSENTFVKLEYRYSNYEGDISRNQAVGGFGFRF